MLVAGNRDHRTVQFCSAAVETAASVEGLDGWAVDKVESHFTDVCRTVLAYLNCLKNAVVARVDGTGLLGELILVIPVTDQIAVLAMRFCLSDKRGSNR